jgi:glycosyltransferase involved in cell wall biosynthesis
MFVECRRSTDPNVVDFAPRTDLPGRIMRSVRREYLRRTFAKSVEGRPGGADMFTDDRTEYGLDVVRQLPGADVYHLHWIAGFVDYWTFLPAVTRRAPVVWTLHDMNPFTGGCHYDAGCGLYTDRCGQCPQLSAKEKVDASARIWRRKQAAYRTVPPGRLHVVTPSRWLAGEAKRSALLGSFPVSVIPNGLDVKTFAPRYRRFAREIFELPLDQRVVLRVVDWPELRRKGAACLTQALTALKDRGDTLLATIGPETSLPDVPIPCVSVGYLLDELLLSLAYSVADVFVCPTLQDNLPNTVLEALACGVPIVGFDVGGVPDVVRDGITGILVPAGDDAALGEAIRRLLAEPERLAAMSANCRRIAVEEYTLKVQAKRYIELYERILASN